MKFQVYCTRHHGVVYGEDRTIRLFTPDTFEIDEDRLHCRWGSEDPADHVFVIKEVK